MIKDKHIAKTEIEISLDFKRGDRVARSRDDIDYLDIFGGKVICREGNKSDLTVALTSEGIKLGCEFPPAMVMRYVDNYYVFYEGNTRAISHYAMGVRPLCSISHSLKKFEDLNGNSDSRIFWGFGCEIQDATTYEEIKSGDKIRIIEYLSILPRDVASRFCEENFVNYNFLMEEVKGFSSLDLIERGEIGRIDMIRKLKY